MVTLTVSVTVGTVDGIIVGVAIVPTSVVVTHGVGAVTVMYDWPLHTQALLNCGPLPHTLAHVGMLLGVRVTVPPDLSPRLPRSSRRHKVGLDVLFLAAGPAPVEAL